MSDWGMGASSKKKSPSEVAPYRMEELQCEKCGRDWFFRYRYDSELRQTQDEYGRTLCEACLPRNKKKVKHTPSPPPAAMQISIEEKYGAKK